MKVLRKSLFLLILLVLASTAACQGQAGGEGPQTTWERAKAEGVIRVGFTNENPFGYVTPEGTLTGEDVEVARVIFGKLGIPNLEGVLTEFAGLIPGLQAERFDAVTAGFFIKPKRCEEILFSEPVVCIGNGVAVKAGNPYDIHSYEDMAANPEVRVGVLTGAYEEDYALEAGVPEDRLVIFPDGPSGIAGLQSDRIDVLALNALAIQVLLDNENDPNLERALPFQDPIVDGKSVRGCGGVGFRKEDSDLRDAFNEELANLKESGELLDLIEPFGFTEGELPDLTMEQLCTP
jgi:polar amino acid transport system substrate-binding protein